MNKNVYGNYSLQMAMALRKYAKPDFDRPRNNSVLEMEAMLESFGFLTYVSDKFSKGVWLMGSHYEPTDLGKKVLEEMGVRK
jgi:hypothetical protein